MQNTFADRLLALFNIRPEEARAVTLMSLHYFFLGGAMLYASAGAWAIFLTRFSNAEIPYIYIAIGIVISGITSLLLWIGRAMSLARFLILTLAVLLGGTLLFLFGLLLLPADLQSYIIFPLPIWNQVIASIGALIFWSLNGRIFDVRQSKRFSGVLNANAWLAFAIFGQTTDFLVPLLGGAKGLFGVAALCLAIGMALQKQVLRDHPNTQNQPEKETQAKLPSWRSLLKQPYILTIFGLILVSQIGYYVIDNIFYMQVSLQYASEAEKSQFLGPFWSLIGIIGFLTDTLLTNRLIARYGLSVGLLTTPIIIVITMGVLALTGFTLPALGVVIFVSVALGKIASESLGISLDQSAVQLLYQPIHEKIRARAQGGASIVAATGTTSAGVMLLFFHQVLNVRAEHLALVFLPIAAVWIFAGLRLTRAYPQMLNEAIQQHRIGENQQLWAQDSNVQTIMKRLVSKHPGEIIYAVNLLAQLKHASMRHTVSALLASRYPEVRLDMLRRVEQEQIRRTRPQLIQMAHSDPQPEIRLAAVRALCSLEGNRLNDTLPYLNAEDEAARVGALIGLLKYGGIEGILSAGQQVLGLAQSQTAEARAKAAYVIGETGISDFYSPLIPLLNDPQLAVRQSALEAAGKIKNTHLAHDVIEQLKHISTRAQAARALEALGEEALTDIRYALEERNIPLNAYAQMVRICGHIRSPRAIAILEKELSHEQPAARAATLFALNACGYRATPQTEPVLRAQLNAEHQKCVWMLACLDDVQKYANTELLQSALRQEMKNSIDRQLRLLACLYEARPVLDARSVVSREDASRHAYAMEVLDAILPREIKASILPMLENLPPRETLEMLGKQNAAPCLSLEARLHEMFNNPYIEPFRWLTCACIYTVKNHILPQNLLNQPLLEKTLSPLVQNTHDWAKNVRGSTTMLSIIERVLILKSVELFKFTPDAILAELANCMTEQEVLANEIIFHKDDPGGSMYIIVHGNLAAMDGETLLNTFANRDVVGELSLLDRQPRSATILALQNSLLLRLEQTDFFELMADRVEIAQGIILLLTQKLRDRIQEIAAMRDAPPSNRPKAA
jgi:ATP:ADP antiporter, AAA family